ncbi:hypothetical protein [Mycolicibacterium mucogenicum]|uniref:hypothetical protein n=1 Tax=Mycolicibacterium mucogenicum TaxID=56689 RepID=UPI00076A1B3F|nr:hypothetical protein [Mycolicibacterium mucogenicum]
MITTYSRGNVTLIIDHRIGEAPTTFTIVRAGPLNTDDVRRVNAELNDYPPAHGAHLAQSPQTGYWEVRVDADTVLATDHGDTTADLKWVTTTG